jgi:hypothetical protein
MLPLFAFAIVVVLHAGEWRDPVWRFVMRETPLPRPAVVATLLALLATFVTIAEEWWRCARRANSTRASELRDAT